MARRIVGTRRAKEASNVEECSIPEQPTTAQGHLFEFRHSQPGLLLTRRNTDAIIAFAYIIVFVRRVGEWDCVGTLYPTTRRRNVMPHSRGKSW
jgi:hypothetical protein